MMFDRDYGDFLNRMEDITERKTTLPLCTNIMFSIKKLLKNSYPFDKNILWNTPKFDLYFSLELRVMLRFSTRKLQK